ncbi:MAG: tetratricopeptide repeat protein [Pseudomonadota bacterium]
MALGYWLGLEPDKTMVRAYDESLARYEKREKPDEKHLSYVLNELGLLFEKAGYFSAAIPLLRRALFINKKVLGKEHPSTATSLNNLAFLYKTKGDYDSAEPHYKRALAIREKVLGKEHPSTVASLNNLAFLYKTKGDYDSAESFYKRALAIREKVLGKEHPDTVIVRENLATLQWFKRIKPLLVVSIVVFVLVVV